MKHAIFSLLFVLIAVTSIAQTTGTFKYQAIARDSAGNVYSNKKISIKISILQGTITGTSVYTEKHDIKSNKQGLINLEIGKGNLITGNFNNIEWGKNLHFIKTELDINESGTYINLGTSQILSVPYANYAQVAGTAKSAENVKWQFSNNKLYYNDSFVGMGTNNPATNLHVLKSNDNSIIRVESGALQAGVQVRSANTYMPFINFSSKDYPEKGASIHFNVMDNQLIFKTSAVNDGTREIVWTESGLMGVGTKTPTYKVDIKGDLNLSGTIFQNGKQLITSNWNKSGNNISYSSGLVGIGTNIPATNLHVFNSNDNSIIRVESGALQAGVQVRSANTYMPFINFSSKDYPEKGASIHFNVMDNQLIFKTSAVNDGTREIVWTESGLMGVGTKTPAYKVDIKGDLNFSGTLYQNGKAINPDSPIMKNEFNNYYLNAGKLGIGTSKPASKLEIANGDIFINNATNGIILKSPNGQCWRITINDTGEFQKTSIDCPVSEP